MLLFDGYLTVTNKYRLGHLNALQVFKSQRAPFMPYVIKNASCRFLLLEILQTH